MTDKQFIDFINDKLNFKDGAKIKEFHSLKDVTIKLSAHNLKLLIEYVINDSKSKQKNTFNVEFDWIVFDHEENEKEDE